MLSTPFGILVLGQTFIVSPRRIYLVQYNAADTLRHRASLRRLWAVQTIAHSARTVSKPRSRNWRIHVPVSSVRTLARVVASVAGRVCMATGLDLSRHG